MKFQALILIFLTFLFGCNSKKCRETVEPAPIVIKSLRLDAAIKNAKSTLEIRTILKENPLVAKHFFDNFQYPNDSILASKIYKIISHKSIDTLYSETLDAFKDFDFFVIELQEAFGRLKTYYPQTKTPTLTTVISGLYRDIYIDQEQIIIGLDYFIGENATFRPVNIPDYISKKYDRKHLPSMIMRLISGQNVKNGNENTLLSEMIDHGKNYYLLSKILPCTKMNILFGYTEEEWEAINENESIIWANFVQNELLYETNDLVKQRFIGERPNINEIGDKCPGRIATWLGWRIIDKFMKNNNLSIQNLMILQNHHELFGKSGYKPKG